MHVLVLGEEGEVGYFRLPRAQLEAIGDGPLGMPSINFVSGTIGSVRNIFAPPEGPCVVSSETLVDAIVSNNPVVHILAENPELDADAVIRARLPPSPLAATAPSSTAAPTPTAPLALPAPPAARARKRGRTA
ncbi:hypothetical protein ACP70R_003089 [Stipagrostis hirtigluma subsp. patula]